jgi:hypothetical protein
MSGAGVMRAVTRVAWALAFAAVFWRAAPSALADDGADHAVEAQAHFERGLALADKKAWEDALSEFTRSRELHPTRAAIANAASCLEELLRYDEALDAYETLLAVPGVTEKERAAAEAQIAKLSRYVGAVAVESEPHGAIVSIDGRPRGTTPLGKSLRITVGTRVVRVEKEGYAPFESRLVVASGETRAVGATLSPLAQLGRLRVREARGGSFEVRIDAAVVGRTPWEGAVSAGTHAVSLHGDGDLGAPAQTIVVSMGTASEVSLTAAPLSGELRVEPSPTTAHVVVDGREVSRGTWSGELPSGDHIVEVREDWYEPQRVPVRVSSREPRALRVTLEPVRRVYGDALFGVTALSSYATPEVASCTHACAGLFLGLRGGYAVTPKLGVEIFYVGEMLLKRQNADATANVGVGFGGFSARYQWLERTPITARLWAGAGLVAAGGAVTSYLTPVVGPEVRIGYRLGRGVMVDAGPALFVFALRAVDDAASNFKVDAGLGTTVVLSVGLHVEP